MVAHGTLFDPMNYQLLDCTYYQLLDCTGVRLEGYNTRFEVVDVDVDKLYGDKIRSYFEAHGIELGVCLVNGGDADKRPKVSSLVPFCILS